jgi:hypothetical protein
MNKIVLVKKYSPESICWENLFRKKAIKELTVENIINNYQGFDGDEFLFYSLIGNKSDFDLRVDKFIEQTKPTGDNSILFICPVNSIKPGSLDNKFTQIGLDFGVCEEDKSVYSSIFNEVIFGCVAELVHYQDCLNENLLFSNLNFAKNYALDHRELYLQGKDIEEDGDMNIYEVWKYNNHFRHL